MLWLLIMNSDTEDSVDAAKLFCFSIVDKMKFFSPLFLVGWQTFTCIELASASKSQLTVLLPAVLYSVMSFATDNYEPSHYFYRFATSLNYISPFKVSLACYSILDVHSLSAIKQFFEANRTYRTNAGQIRNNRAEFRYLCAWRRK